MPENKPDFSEIMKTAKEMQDKMKDLQNEITNMQIIGESGGGLVKITFNGQHHAQNVNLEPTLLIEEKGVIEDLIAAAINDAANKIETETKNKMTSLTGIKLPEGLDDQTGS